jgi:hypothetical protein
LNRGVLRRNAANRTGALMVLAAILIVVMVVLAAFAIDLGHLRVTRAELRNAADAASLAGAGTLRDTGSVSLARAEAVRFARLNRAGGKPVELDPMADVVFGSGTFNSATGRWDFVAGRQPFDSVQVRARRTAGSPGGAVPLFFGRTIGSGVADSQAGAVATFLPRDIGLVIDLSGSMLYDSTLLHESATPINNREVWVALGSPRFGAMNDWAKLQSLSGGTSTIISQLQLTNVPYPYPQGSWAEFVNYVQTDSRLPGSYRNKYGLKTWLDYVLQRRSYKTSTPILATTPEQPVAALKGAVGIMLDYLESLDTDEHVSLSTYDSLARIERNLSTDLAAISTRMREMQAGHYDRETNIGDGIRRGCESLTGSYARPGAKKVMIVFTDGLANEPGTEANARLYALAQARLAADADITIHTISFTSQADQSLMAEIAKIGKGVHFHVPGYDMAQYSRELERVLLTISSIRPLALTQ